jgi:hypothetical protein
VGSERAALRGHRVFFCRCEKTFERFCFCHRSMLARLQDQPAR